MKFNKNVLALLTLVFVTLGRLACMPGTTTSTDTTTLDSQITTNLSGLSGCNTFSGKLDILNSILNSAAGQAVSQSVQISYYDAVKNFDAFARAYSLTKAQISQLIKFLKALQTSTLIYSGAALDLTARINYWNKKTKTVGLTPEQRALQRRRSN